MDNGVEAQPKIERIQIYLILSKMIRIMHNQFFVSFNLLFHSGVQAFFNIQVVNFDQFFSVDFLCVAFKLHFYFFGKRFLNMWFVALVEMKSLSVVQNSLDFLRYYFFFFFTELAQAL